MTKRTTGPKPGTGTAANAKRKVIDANIRQIFEEHGTQKEHLKQALDYLHENDPIGYVHAFLKLLSVTHATASPVRNVTNVFAEQINAPRVVQHLEELARFSEAAGDAASLSNEPVLLIDDRTKAN